MTANFCNLRANRKNAPIYLLEHGLPESDLANLLNATRGGLRQHTIEGDWWSTRALPLLVAATEIGYQYRGTGTDFWPIFADRFGVTNQFDRGALSSLFQDAAMRLGLAQPADTPWNRAFCHIAWPVLHAVLPVELHRPLARSLRDVRSRLDLEGSDAALVAQIRARAQLSGGIRLLAWLEDQSTAAAIVRYFLNPTSATSIEPAALARIAADLARDEIANAALRDARNRQKALESKRMARASRRRSEVQTRYVPLVLRPVDQRWSLGLKIPQMEQTEREAARCALDAIRWRALLWSRGRPVPSRNLFSDFPIPIAVDDLPSAETPLLGDLAALPLTQEAKNFLGSLRVQTSAPLLFSDENSAGDHVQVHSDQVTFGGRYVVLISPDQPTPPSGIESLGRVAGMRAYRVDSAAPSDVDWLSRLGITVRKSAQFVWLGAPEVEQHRPVPRFVRGEFVAFEVGGADSAGDVQLIEPEGEQSAVSTSERLLFGFNPDDIGTYTVRYGAGETTTFEVVESPNYEPLLAIHIDAGIGAISDLAGHGVTLWFDSDAAIQEASFELCLLCDGRLVKSTVDILPDTPCKIGTDHGVWDALLSADALEQLLVANTADLIVSVRGLAEESFRFEQVTAPFGWSRNADGSFRAADETGELALFAARPGEPLRVSAGGSAERNHDIILLRAGYDRPLQTGGLCLGPKIWRASEAEPVSHPTRLLRQFDVGRDGIADGRSLADALIAWSAASVDHPITQYRRGQIVRQLEQWLVEQLCGSEWALREAALTSRRAGSFSEAFLDACARLGVGFADVSLSEAQHALLRRISLRLLDSRGLPISIEISREPINDALAAELDNLFNDAYTVLAEEITLAGDYCPFDPAEEVDVGEPSERWDQALREAASKAAFLDLVDLLRPLEAGDALSLADFESMQRDDVIDLMTEWITRNRPAHQARSWSRDLVEAAYWLFAKPALAARLSWAAASQRLLADSFSARGIRYAALRSGGLTEVR